MAETQATIFSREWWITVALVGVGIHLAASYLKPRLDQIGGWFSGSWANRNAARSKARQERIERFKNSAEEVRDATEEEFRDILYAILMAVFGGIAFISLLLPGSTRHSVLNAGFDIGTGIIGLLLIVLALTFAIKANASRIEVLEARKDVLMQEMERIDAELKIAKAEALMAQKKLDEAGNE